MHFWNSRGGRNSISWEKTVRPAFIRHCHCSEQYRQVRLKRPSAFQIVFAPKPTYHIQSTSLALSSRKFPRTRVVLSIESESVSNKRKRHHWMICLEKRPDELISWGHAPTLSLIHISEPTRRTPIS